jgi:alpha-glucosidase
VYQIYPRSFCDSDGDGVGDLEGIRRHLDHLSWLGVDALWLSPFFRSPMRDYGYDVSDHCDVDPLFGDLADFDALLADAHERGLRVLVDWVPNHTSDLHPWFVASRSSRDDPRRDWYVWRDPSLDGSPPNNWTESLTLGPAWTFDDATGQYYLHNFLPSQPDLNWANPEVVAAMHDTLRFWLDRGVDGFRMDVVNLIGKDAALADDPEDVVGLPHVVVNDRPETRQLLRGIRSVLDSYPGDRMAIGEVMLLQIDRIVDHLGPEGLHLAFNFPPLFGPWDPATWRRNIVETEQAHGSKGCWPTWVLSNHDQPRFRSRHGGSEAVARAAAVLELTLRGTVFLYMGEELGLSDAVVPPDRRHDPAGRDGCRAPIPWDRADGHGWASVEPWLPWPPEVDTHDVESERATPTSTLHLYRDLLALRRATPALRDGSIELLDAPSGVVAYERRHESSVVRVAVNFTDEGQKLAGWHDALAISSFGRDEIDEWLEPGEAVVVVGRGG